MNKTKAILRNMTEEEIRAADEAYFKLIERRMELELKLIEKMPEELMELFTEYMDIETEVIAAEGEEEYARGFENGMQMMVDTLRDSRK